jgi:adenine deaminase
LSARKPLEHLIKAALGRKKASLVIKNARIYNSFNGGFRVADLAVEEGYIAGVGSYDGIEVIHADNLYLLPGFVDSHVHIESSMTAPGEFARALAASGTTTVVADPHEIANVAGLAGLDFFLEESGNVPVDIFFMLPTCVPATSFERGGAALTASDLAPYLERPGVLGLAEMMNYPGVISRAPGVMEKLELASNRPENLRPIRVDGHAPGLLARELNAYLAAGIDTDHEATTPGELSEKISAGMFMLLREGSAARNLLPLLPSVTHFNSRFCALCTDDRHAGDLIDEGSVNHLVRVATSSGTAGLPEILNMASLNGAAHYGLRDRGALAPGYRADMALYHDLWSFRPSMVWKNGALVARDGECLIPPKNSYGKSAALVRNSVRLGELDKKDLLVKDRGKVRVIGVRPREIITDSLVMELPREKSHLLADPERDVAKMAVYDRYRPGTKPAVGFIKGLGLRRGALATTVSHDSHNLCVCGAADGDMLLCARRAAELEGGLVLALDGNIVAEMALPLGGLMSLKTLKETAADIKKLKTDAELLGFPKGCDPFMTLAFMSLPVIPSLKLTSRGLVDVDRFEIVPLHP